MNYRIRKTLLILLSLLSITACSTTYTLVNTPNIYLTELGYPNRNVTESLQTVTPEILFITDRKPVAVVDGKLSYGTERSASMAFGKTEITFGDGINWNDLKRESGKKNRVKDLQLSVSKTTELVRFPTTPLPFFIKDKALVTEPLTEAKYTEASRLAKTHIQSSLQATASKDIIFFVHGFNNDFHDAAISLANIWHFTGRNTVPIFFTWPAASGGLFGYFKDREAGEFSIFHLKESLRLLSSMDSIDNIHVIAHSRGTDITTTALRELVIEARASGKNPRDSLKIKSLVLAAPDLDFGVVKQRLIAERFGPAIGQITVYMNKDDEALGLSQFLMSGLRFGKLATQDLGENEQEIFGQILNVSFVNVEDVSSFVGHSYFIKNSGVLSDIAITVNKSLRPGTEGRPLTQDRFNFWTLPRGYPNRK